MTARRPWRSALLWALAPIAFLSWFYFFPLVRIVETSLAHGLTHEAGWRAALPDWETVVQVFSFTFRQALISTGLTLAAGLPIAWWAKHRGVPGQRTIQVMLTLPFVMPTVVVAAAFSALVGPGGLLNLWAMRLFGLSDPPIELLHTFSLIILAHLFYNVSVVVRIVSGFWRELDPRLRMAASVLGANPIRQWLSVELPLILPSLLSASLLVFLFCFSSFGIILLLGGLRFATVEVEIYRQAVSFFNLPTAAFLSLLQLAVTFATMKIYTQLQHDSGRALAVNIGEVAGYQSQHGLRVARWLALPVGLFACLLLLPLFALAFQSVSLGDQGWTLQYYTSLFQDVERGAFLASPGAAMGNSLRIALLTMLLSLALGTCMAYAVSEAPPKLGRWLDPIFLLPLGTSAVTLGLGFIIAMGPLRRSPWLVPIAHSLIATPFVLRVMLPSLRRLPPSLRAASGVLGASPWRTWFSIDLPLLVPALTVAGVFAFAVSLGEFGASLLVSRPQHPTMPLMIYRFLGMPGLMNLGMAMAMGTILMVVAGCSMYLLDRLPVNIREF